VRARGNTISGARGRLGGRVFCGPQGGGGRGKERTTVDGRENGEKKKKKRIPEEKVKNHSVLTSQYRISTRIRGKKGIKGLWGGITGN